MKNEKIYSKEDIKSFFQQLHFCEGLEDVSFLYSLKEEALKKWCESHGRKLHQISFALAIDGDLEYVLNKLTIAEKKEETR